MAISLKKISNPYSIFAIAWLICLVLYSFGWAEIFPPLSSSLSFFLSCLILIFGLTGFLYTKLKISTSNVPSKFRYKSLLILNTLFYASNFLYSGIPILKGVRPDEFGIPTIIVFATTLNCFTSVYCFFLFLITKKKKFIFYSAFCLSFFVMVFSRGNIVMSLMTMFFLWINVRLPRLTVSKVIGILTGFLLVAFLFGVAGNFRTINDLNNQGITNDDSYNSNVIMGLGGASESFKSSIVPGEFFWTYLYITSPLSNLQYNINKNKPQPTAISFTYLFIDEILFDAVSKRIDSILGRKRNNVDLVVEQLTVPTTLAGCYDYGGWYGMAFFMIVFWTFPFIYILFIMDNPLGVIGVSTLCTVYFFSIFDNMFILTALMLQIFFPIILHMLTKIQIRKLIFDVG